MNQMTRSVQSDEPLRFVLCHIHPVSARLRFLIDAQSEVGPSVCFPHPLPSLASLLEGGSSKSTASSIHPQSHLQKLSEQLAIDNSALALVKGFRAWIDVPGSTLPVFLVRVDRDQPIPAPEGCQWIEMPQCRRLTDAELLLVRAVYDWFLGHEA